MTSQRRNSFKRMLSLCAVPIFAFWNDKDHATLEVNGKDKKGKVTRHEKMLNPKHSWPGLYQSFLAHCSRFDQAHKQVLTQFLPPLETSSLIYFYNEVGTWVETHLITHYRTKNHESELLVWLSHFSCSSNKEVDQITISLYMLKILILNYYKYYSPFESRHYML